MGVFGNWGRGKSTVVRMIKAELCCLRAAWLCVKGLMMNISYNLTVELEPNSEEVSFLRGKLTEFNHAHMNLDRYQSLVIFLRDTENNIIGSMTGST